MGAYYTKEDITEYISKNTIIPFLFDQVKKECANAFHEDSSLWKMLRENPDRYIYDAVKHGIYLENNTPLSSLLERGKRGVLRELPPEIQKGINPEIQKRIVKDVDKNPPQLLELRKDWNKPAPPEYALPTEIWREVVERRNRYFDIKKKIETGEIKEINDFITYNLDIRQFAQDAVEQYEGSDFINAFFKAISKISILDPTSGSAAFLFAALNILEPLFEACLKRMREFIEEDDLKGGKRYPQFRKVLQEIEHHPNEKYFIYKSIILNNLYGVDIMNEAVEIAKLRLFLKLVAEIDVDYNKPNLGLEPLPDIDFNIRCGNTLVGFTRLEDVKKALEGKLNFNEDLIDKIDEKAELVNKAFKYFKDSQINLESSVLISAKKGVRDDGSYAGFIKAKKELEKRLQKLNEELNLYLAKLYSKNPAKKKEYEHWLATHKPFHWFAEFYEIMNSGGFDVIIGNPPYVEYSSVLGTYQVQGYATRSCGNLYSFVLERSRVVLHRQGYIGMIVPMSLTSIRDYEVLRSLIMKEFPISWTTNHAIRPVSLFTGISQRVSILVGTSGKSTDGKQYYTKYYRTTPELKNLFHNISYTNAKGVEEVGGLLPKISSDCERTIWGKVFKKGKPQILFDGNSRNRIFFKDYGETYWVFPVNFVPYKTLVKSYKSECFADGEVRDCTVSFLNCNLFYWYYTAISDCWHFGAWHMVNFPFGYDDLKPSLKNRLMSLCSDLMESYKKNRIVRYDSRIDGDLYEYKVYKSKNLIDEIDKVLAKHYGFTEEELDFIINYDTKYRMGRDTGED